jgi:hypothetical protein
MDGVTGSGDLASASAAAPEVEKDDELANGVTATRIREYSEKKGRRSMVNICNRKPKGKLRNSCRHKAFKQFQLL